MFFFVLSPRNFAASHRARIDTAVRHVSHFLPSAFSHGDVFDAGRYPVYQLLPSLFSLSLDVRSSPCFSVFSPSPKKGLTGKYACLMSSPSVFAYLSPASVLTTLFVATSPPDCLPQRAASRLRRATTTSRAARSSSPRGGRPRSSSSGPPWLPLPLQQQQPPPFQPPQHQSRRRNGASSTPAPSRNGGATRGLCPGAARRSRRWLRERPGASVARPSAGGNLFGAASVEEAGGAVAPEGSRREWRWTLSAACSGLPGSSALPRRARLARRCLPRQPRSYTMAPPPPPHPPAPLPTST